MRGKTDKQTGGRPTVGQRERERERDRERDRLSDRHYNTV
jgi:hypothetical protein